MFCNARRRAARHGAVSPCEGELEAVTNPTTLTLIHSWLALAERNNAHLEKANTAAAALRGIDARRLTPIQARALADLTLLNANLND